MPNNQAVTRQDVSNNNKTDSRPNKPPLQTSQSNVAQPIDTADAPVCFYHQTLVTEHACAENLARFLQTNRPEQGSDSCIWRINRGATWLCGSFFSQLIPL